MAPTCLRAIGHHRCVICYLHISLIGSLECYAMEYVSLKPFLMKVIPKDTKGLTSFYMTIFLFFFRQERCSFFISNHIKTKTYLYNFDPLKPHFYIRNRGLQGYILFFLCFDWADIFHISAQNIDCRYSLEPPHRGSSYKYPQAHHENMPI